MLRNVRSITAICLVCVASLVCRSPTRADDHDQQFWPELDVYYRLNPNARLFFLLAPVTEVQDGQRAVNDTQVGAHIEVGILPIGKGRREKSRYDNDRMSYLRFRTGLRYLEVVGDPSKDEWRVIGEVTGRAHLPAEMLLAFRNRLDLRWIDEEYSWRYRPRLWLEREFKTGTRMAFVPYGSAEVFWDSRYDDWNRQRYQLGSAIVLKKWFAPEVYWAHQIDDGSDGDTITDALGFALAFYF